MSQTVDSASWMNRTSHRHWLIAEGLDLLEFYRAACLPGGGFGPLDINGQLVDEQADTLITARMTHCYALAHLQGVPGAATLVDHGLTALNEQLQDSQYGGWFSQQPRADLNDDKPCYIQVFVALAAASATAADLPGARALLDQALQVLEQYFWSAAEQAYVDTWSRDWQQLADYRGANANMHAVELCLSLADVLDDNGWRRRALAIAEHLINQNARANGWHVIEHFDGQWRYLPDYNKEAPADGFKPYGVTPGHGCEWARLLLHLEAGLQDAGDAAPAWLAEAAANLFAIAMRDAWQADGQPGMVYTLDWQGQPVSGRRRHWVHAEAVAAAAALVKRTGQAYYEDYYRQIWDFIRDAYIDAERGSWFQELDDELNLDRQEGHLKADLYHAYQATLLPQLSLAPTLPLAITEL